MIQATELMLGDYVRVEVDDNEFDIDYICDIICNIGYVPEWDALGVMTCHNGNDWLREAEIYPVPLTKEILEKNGFIYNDMPSAQSWEQFGLSIYGDGLINCGQNIALQVKYVHQLQHALKLCNIQKEIQL